MTSSANQLVEITASRAQHLNVKCVDIASVLF